MDFIFGTYATDELKLVQHRAARRGLQHQHVIHPQDPRPGEAVTLTVSCGPDLDAKHLACYYTWDGSEPTGRRGVATHGAAIALTQTDTIWDTLSWGYLTRWEVTLPARPEGTVVRYRLGAWADGSPEVFADRPDATDASEQATRAFFAGETPPADLLPEDPRGDTFSYHVDTLAPPAWAEDAAIYQIFVDRFFPGEGRGWLQTDDLTGFCGGTLWGVRDKLDYLADLGATCLWLSPTWSSPTPHGYTIDDYDHVEPRLGGDEALKAVIEGAHKRGMRVLLDLVCNHLSNLHPYFIQARADPDSPYRAWFRFDDSALGYRAFFGLETMPEINLTHDPARDWMLGIARRWLRELDADGYRLDYANGPGPDFWAGFRAACKEEKPDCFCFGEIIDSPEAVRRYVGRLDGCLDFQVNEALRKTYAWGAWSEADFARFLKRHRDFFPPGFVMANFLDSHDMDRFLFIAGGDLEALKRAAAVQMSLPGPAILYYGTEAGLSQTADTQAGGGLHVSRQPMVWGDAQDQPLVDFYRHLLRERATRSADKRAALAPGA